MSKFVRQVVTILPWPRAACSDAGQLAVVGGEVQPESNRASLAGHLERGSRRET